MDALIVALAISVAIGGGANDSGAAPGPLVWHTYRNATFGYELQHPERYEIRSTGPENARDGSRIRVAQKGYAAPAPVLDIYVLEAAAAARLPSSVDAHWNRATIDVEIGDMPCLMTTYRFRPGGQIPMVEVRCPEVLFRLDPGTDITDVQATIWWQIMSTFRFVRVQTSTPPGTNRVLEDP